MYIYEGYMLKFRMGYFEDSKNCSIDKIRLEELQYEKQLKNALKKYGLELRFDAINHHGFSLK